MKVAYIAVKLRNITVKVCNIVARDGYNTVKVRLALRALLLSVYFSCIFNSSAFAVRAAIGGLVLVLFRRSGFAGWTPCCGAA